MSRLQWQDLIDNHGPVVGREMMVVVGALRETFIALILAISLEEAAARVSVTNTVKVYAEARSSLYVSEFLFQYDLIGVYPWGDDTIHVHEDMNSLSPPGHIRCTGIRCWREDDGIFYSHTTVEGTLISQEICSTCGGGRLRPSSISALTRFKASSFCLYEGRRDRDVLKHRCVESEKHG